MVLLSFKLSKPAFNGFFFKKIVGVSCRLSCSVKVSTESLLENLCGFIQGNDENGVNGFGLFESNIEEFFFKRTDKLIFRGFSTKFKGCWIFSRVLPFFLIKLAFFSFLAFD